MKPITCLRFVPGVGAAGLIVMLGACAATDPLISANSWHPIGANERNIAAQVVNPADLQHGRAPDADGDGQLAAAAVARLRTGHVKALPDSSLTDLKIQGSPSSSGSP